jgi:hypothetical protein
MSLLRTGLVLYDRTGKPEPDRVSEERRLKGAPFPPVRCKKLRFSEFCDYRNTLPPLLAAHAVVYVRRWVPVMRPIVRCDEFGRVYFEHPSCLKIYKDHGPLTEDLFIEKLGCGDYSFRLNDRRISLQTDPNAATVVYSELSTWRDWSAHPPVLDYEQLDRNHPHNSGFLAWLDLAEDVGGAGHRPFSSGISRWDLSAPESNPRQCFTRGPFDTRFGSRNW